MCVFNATFPSHVHLQSHSPRVLSSARRSSQLRHRPRRLSSSLSCRATQTVPSGLTLAPGAYARVTSPLARYLQTSAPRHPPACSQLKVLNSSALNYLSQPIFNLTVKAYLSDLSSSFTLATVTVVLTPVPTAPVVALQMLTVPAHAPPGTVLGVLNYTARLPINVTWSYGVDTSNGLFAIDGPTGIVTVGPNTTASNISFFSATTSYSLLVTATGTTLVRTGCR